MKKLLATILVIFIVTSGYGQCLDINFLYSLFDKGYSSIDDKLNDRGYLFNEASDNAINWIKTDVNKSISVIFDSSKNVQEISYQLTSDTGCYNSLKDDLSDKGYALDYEELSYLTKVGLPGGINYYFKGKSFGALLIKSNLGDGVIYQFILMSLARYEAELKDAKQQ